MDPTVTPSSNGWFSDFTSALLHHLANPIYGGFQAWDNALTGGLTALAPNSPLANWSANQTATFNNVVNNRENAYQAAVPTNNASMAGALAGDLAPWIGGPLLGTLSKAGDAAAALPALAKIPYGPMVAREGTMGLLSAIPQPIANSSDYWGDKAKQMGQWGLLGAAAGPVAGGSENFPDLLNGVMKYGPYAPVAQPLLGGLGL